MHTLLCGSVDTKYRFFSRVYFITFSVGCTQYIFVFNRNTGQLFCILWSASRLFSVSLPNDFNE